MKPNGLNINKNCGSTYPEKIKSVVKKNKINIGISLDGDADRIIVCDENSNIVDGDQIIAMLASRWKKKRILKLNLSHLQILKLLELGFQKIKL